jgi:hypothetical protein
VFGGDFGRLRGARQRTRQDQVRTHFESGKERADLVHFFFPAFRQRAFVI